MEHVGHIGKFLNNGFNLCFIDGIYRIRSDMIWINGQSMHHKSFGIYELEAEAIRNKIEIDVKTCAPKNPRSQQVTTGIVFNQR